MNYLLTYFLIPLAAYSLGAVPFGLLLCLVFKGVDIREHGSRNIGATNAGRVCGFVFFLAAFALDFGKGLAPVIFGGALAKAYGAGASLEWLKILYGALAIIGHSFPAHLGFRGGKAVATSFGVFVGLAPVAALITFGVWGFFFVAFRYVSLASMAAAVAAPIAYAALAMNRGEIVRRSPILYFTVLVAVLVLFRHRSNIRRLLAGTEPRFRLRGKPD